jgi:hypothetical protein
MVSGAMEFTAGVDAKELAAVHKAARTVMQ